MKNEKVMMLPAQISLVSNVILLTIKLITLLIVNLLAVAADSGISVVTLVVKPERVNL